MVSDFRQKKLQHVFNVFFDVNQSGSIDKKDFDAAIEKAAKVRGWSTSDAKYKQVQETLNKIWDGLQSKADADKDGEVSFNEWVAMWEEYAKNPAAALEWQNLYAKFIFDLEDASSDGSIDSEEFATVYTAYGLNAADSKAAFQKMSKGKANVTWAEFQSLWKEYFVSDDVNAPGNFIFGKTSFWAVDLNVVG